MARFQRTMSAVRSASMKPGCERGIPCRLFVRSSFIDERLQKRLPPVIVQAGNDFGSRRRRCPEKYALKATHLEGGSLREAKKNRFFAHESCLQLSRQAHLPE